MRLAAPARGVVIGLGLLTAVGCALVLGLDQKQATSQDAGASGDGGSEANGESGANTGTEAGVLCGTTYCHIPDQECCCAGNYCHNATDPRSCVAVGTCNGFAIQCDEPTDCVWLGDAAVCCGSCPGGNCYSSVQCAASQADCNNCPGDGPPSGPSRCMCDPNAGASQCPLVAPYCGHSSALPGYGFCNP